MNSFEFVAWSTGLANAPATFMDIMNELFLSKLDTFVNAYRDSILVYSKTFEDHYERLAIVIKRLREEKL